MHRLLISLCILLTSLSAQSVDITWTECMKAASQMNSAMPMSVDKITEGRNVFCRDERGQTVMVVVYQVHAKKDEVNIGNLMVQLQTRMTAQVCGDPETKR